VAGAAQVAAVSVGQPKRVPWRGQEVESGIFKAPVEGRVAVRRLNLDGDRQADLTVHGGEFKAVYAYAAEHYAWWRAQRPDLEFGAGRFGENLMTERLELEALGIGDTVRAGTALLRTIQPRLPCYKLGIRMGDHRFVADFLRAERTGTYFAVLEEGDVGAGDAIEVVARDPAGVAVRELTTAIKAQGRDAEAVRRLLGAEHLIPAWRGWLEGA